MENKHVGYLIIAITLIFLVIVISFNGALESIVSASCTHGNSCPMHATLETQKMISYGLISLLFLIGIVVGFFLKDKKEHPTKKQSKKKINIDSLDEREKHIIQILQREDGSVYQSDIIKETKASKVKVSRVLDKLEGKGLIERKRRGMTNIVILKNPENY